MEILMGIRYDRCIVVELNLGMVVMSVVVVVVVVVNSNPRHKMTRNTRHPTQTLLPNLAWYAVRSLWEHT